MINLHHRQRHPDVGLLAHLMTPPLPPEKPTTPPPWEASPRDLPSDYRDFVDLYGGGLAGGELVIHTPTRETGGFEGFLAFARAPLARLTTLRAPVDRATLIHEDLLCWGNADHAVFTWQTTSPDGRSIPADDWSVVILTYRDGSAHRERFEGGMVAFLLAAAFTPHTAIPALAEDPYWIRTADWHQGYGGAAA